MFGLILKIQALLDKLRKNKGLWFSILTAASVLGIVGTLYYLNTMTERVTKNLYESTNAGYFYDLEQTLSNTAQKLQAATALSVANQGYAASFVSANGAETLKAIASAVKGESNVDIVVDFYSKELIRVASSMESLNAVKIQYDSKILQKVVSTQKPQSGTEYQDGHVYIKSAYPTPAGVLEIKQNIDSLYDIYSANGKIFQVLLDRELLDMKKLQDYKSQAVGKNEISVQSKTDGEFLQKAGELDFAKIVEQKYIITDGYFILAKPILNSDGKRVGVYVIAERYMENNTLPKMVKSMSTGLTTAALGLVVALLALMV